MKCHLANGAGHPESADLTGLSSAYIRQQMEAFANGLRAGLRGASMIPIARDATGQEVAESARYFSALPPVPPGWRQVIEADVVPHTTLGIGGMRYAQEGQGSEPLGQRIIEVPQYPERTESRDSRAGFMAYVPRGSVARGKVLVSTGAGKTAACASCHGADLQGNDPALRTLGEVPPIIGRSPLYTFRQLNDFKAGTRSGPLAAPMLGVVARLDVDDMIAIAAYLAAPVSALHP
jgi:cytochrome c553